MDLLSEIFLGVVLAVFLLKAYLTLRQMNSIKQHRASVPNNFVTSITLTEHQKAADYNLAKLQLGIIENIVSTIILGAFTLGGGIQAINNHFVISENYPLTQGLVIVGIFSLINALLSLPFTLYLTFNIEQKFGFNNTSVKLFIIDQIKGIVLSAMIGIPFLYLVLWLMAIMGNLWWIWVWGAFVALNLLMLLIYPIFIAPFFNKFTPLTDEILKEKINTLLQTCGFKSRGIFVMDGSKRSSHGNAYFTGIGKSKRIVFFDTLIKQLTPDEITAVLAHELGHFKHKHVLKQIVLSFTLTLVILFGLSILINMPLFYQALGVTTMTTYNGLILFMLILGVFSVPFAPIFSYFSRKNEFEADRFAKQHTNKQDLINGLVKLYKDNASTLTPDDLYVKFYYSHPPATVRIAQLEKN